MASGRCKGEQLDIALDAAGPVLAILEKGLELVPVPGLGMIPKALSLIVDKVKVSASSLSAVHLA